MNNECGECEDENKPNNKCWNTKCNKIGWIEIVGWHYCIKHWRMDYKWGMGHGLKLAIKLSKFNFRKLFFK